MDNSRKLAAEFIGTFWLVLGGCGAAVLAAGVPDVGIGYAGVALAFGLTVLTGAYAFGHISGAHFNPAVTFGLFTAGRFPAKDIIPYWIAQVLGGLAAGAVLYLIASGTSGFDASASGFASNGYGDHSPQHYSMMAGADVRDRDDLHVPDGDPGRHLLYRAGRLRAARDRSGADADPSDLDPGDQHLGQPGALDGVLRSSRAAGRWSSFGCSG